MWLWDSSFVYANKILILCSPPPDWLFCFLPFAFPPLFGSVFSMSVFCKISSPEILWFGNYFISWKSINLVVYSAKKSGTLIILPSCAKFRIEKRILVCGSYLSLYHIFMRLTHFLTYFWYNLHIFGSISSVFVHIFSKNNSIRYGTELFPHFLIHIFKRFRNRFYRLLKSW